MSKMALIAVAIFMLAGAHLAFNTQGNLTQSETRLAEDQFEILARNAAVAGLDRVKQKLSDDFSAYGNVMGTNDGIDYTVNTVINGDVATVHSIATTYLADKPVTFNVKAKFKRRGIIPDEAPPFMRYAIISEGDLLLKGNTSGDIYIDGDTDNLLNANMHTNGTLDVNSNSILVKGFGTYVLTVLPSVAGASDSFVPNHNPTGADPIYQTQTVNIPHMNPAMLALSANPDFVTNGDEELSGTYDFGTREDPYVWHIQGNLDIKNGNTTIDGYALFLVDGEIEFQGNVHVGNSSYTGGDESSIAFYANDGIEVKGGTEVWAQIYSDRNVTFAAGSTKIYGSVTTKGEIDFRGGADIFYRKASPALTRQLQPDIIRLDRIAYSEW